MEHSSSAPPVNWDFFQFSAIINKTSLSIHIQVFVWTCVFISPGSYLGGGMVKCTYDLMRNCKTVFKSGYTLFCSSSHVWDFSCASCLSALGLSIFHVGCFHPNRCVSASCGFHLHFPNGGWCWITVHMLMCQANLLLSVPSVNSSAHF